jgi:flagellin-like protein
MKYLEKFLKDQRGVSPVIGVILMVAITVVMGAVVAGFAYGYLGNTPKAPNVALSVIDDPTDNITVLVKHSGGESIVASE